MIPEVLVSMTSSLTVINMLFVFVKLVFHFNYWLAENNNAFNTDFKRQQMNDLLSLVLFYVDYSYLCRQFFIIMRNVYDGLFAYLASYGYGGFGSWSIVIRVLPEQGPKSGCFFFKWRLRQLNKIQAVSLRIHTSSIHLCDSLESGGSFCSITRWVWYSTAGGIAQVVLDGIGGWNGLWGKPEGGNNLF